MEHLEYIKNQPLKDMPNEIIERFPIGSQVIILQETFFWEKGLIATVLNYHRLNDENYSIWIEDGKHIYPIMYNQIASFILSENFEIE